MSQTAENNLWNIVQNKEIDIKTLSGIKCGDVEFKVTVTTNALGLAVAPTNNKDFLDYYFITQFFYIDPSQCYLFKSNKHQGWYVIEYEISLYPIVDGDIKENDKETVQILKSSPESLVGEKTVTVGTSFSFEANLGFFEALPTGGVSSGYHVSNSYSFQKPDVKIVNYADFRKVQWKFKMNDIECEKETQGEISNKTLKEPTLIQTSSFQPVRASVWRLTKRDNSLYGRGISFETEFKAQMKLKRIKQEDLTPPPSEHLLWPMRIINDKVIEEEHITSQRHRFVIKPQKIR